jgi:hypothetical protein
MSGLDELCAGLDESLRAEVRAKNLFAAAMLVRANGMELFGTEWEPDWAIHGGDFDFGLTWRVQASPL